ncbi:MAG: lysophospholipid acyltransferase family protein [Nanoarchaeota archaeon]
MVYPVLNQTLFNLARLWVRKVTGLENLKKTKVFIFASNHGSFADDIILPAIIVKYLQVNLHIYCNDRFYKNFFLRKFLEFGRCIPIRVGEKTEEANKINQKAFDMAVNFLRNEKEIVGIFPEGGRTKDGKLMPAKWGVAKLALAARVPVIPIGAIGTYDIWPKGSPFPRFKRCEIHIGEPIYLDKFYGMEDNQNILKEITTLIMKDIAKLSKLEYNY